MRNRSFTLIEVIIATGIFALLCILCMKLTSSSLSNYEAQKDRARHISQLVILDKTLRKMFSNMVPFNWRDESGDKQSFFYGAVNEMRFAQLNKVNTLKDGGMRFIELILNEENELVANYQTRPFFNGEELIEGKYYTSLLAKDVEQIEFSYVSAIEESQSSEELEWLNEWLEERQDIPLAILLKVRWRDGSEENFMWRTAASSYDERLAPWDNGKLTQ
ncbi:prepilin-type N-terminal cleavage/methylation domain-containing protein [Lentisphaera profundi]|uniref:Prepilin-type N-terminal cleavage/methylation domain-containing protein n=1 Tax=Lentisphaera profundi TaxID=1658616 RepID=A0ABY7VY07_9BACT|nr:prepilin-type N-terminal cleavage/methylation domain-containing protein [Lentisphaera profundi]WDE97676.1 prepilin-type N-terminal cleavage/methylation domain-containing protein [Lentisphaera profundi]